MPVHTEISFSSGAFLATPQAYLKKDFKTQEPIKNDGNFLFQVSVIVPSEREAETLEVIVPAKKNPVENLAPMEPLNFSGLILSTGKMNGKKWYTYRADAVVSAV